MTFESSVESLPHDAPAFFNDEAYYDFDSPTVLIRAKATFKLSF